MNSKTVISTAGLRRLRVLRLVLFLLLGPASVGVCSAQVPAVYQDLYTQLTGDINDFQAAITNQWDGSKYAVDFSAQLTAANSNNGSNLLTSFTLIQSEIQQLKALGVKAVSVEVSFPMLYQPFFNSIGHPEYQAQFVMLYSNVASAIRAQGMQVIVESQSLIPTGLQSVWGVGLQSFYASLTNDFSSYITARSNTVSVVAQTMQPDFFVLQEEPDTEANQSGQPQVGTVAGSTRMLSNSIVAARLANVPGMKIGAGFGSWLQAYQLFANSFTEQHCGEIINGQTQMCLPQPLDFLDLHLFPITEDTVYGSPPPNPKPCTYSNFWQNAMNILATASAAGVPMTISQTWLRKVRDAEWLQINGDIEEGREAYSFWAPLDLSFLQTVYDFANYGHLLFVVPFNSQNYYAYLDWSASTALQGDGGTNTPAQIFRAVQNLGLTNAAAGIYSSTGTGYNALILQRPQFTGFQFKTNGSFHLTVSGSPNVNYTILAAPTVNGTWTNLATLSSSNGVINYDDPPPSGAAKFYRGMIAP